MNNTKSMRLYAVTWRDKLHYNEAERHQCEYFSKKADAVAAYESYLALKELEGPKPWFGLTLFGIVIRPGEDNIVDWLENWNGRVDPYPHTTPRWSVEKIKCSDYLADLTEDGELTDESASVEEGHLSMKP